MSARSVSCEATLRSLQQQSGMYRPSVSATCMIWPHQLTPLQADPHPGNLIRTPDGRLAILDFGLVTQIDDNIKFGMVEAISHLIHRDYEAIAKDFVTLQFIDPGTNLRPILPVLAKVSIKTTYCLANVRACHIKEAAHVCLSGIIVCQCEFTCCLSCHICATAAMINEAVPA